MSVLDNIFGLWWVAVTATVAAAWTIYGAMYGSPLHRNARMMLGVAVAAVALSYWWDIYSDDVLGPAEMRRGAGIVLWPALLWTAVSGVRFARRANAAAHKVVGESFGDKE